MPSSLAHFPREILAKITSHLSGSDIAIRLHGCGDSTLTNKLKTGGVTSFHYRGHVLPQSRIDFIKSLQLESFIIDGTTEHVSLNREMLQGLLPTLRHLHCNNLGPKEVCLTFQTDDKAPDFSPLPLPVRPYASPTWIVRNTYPRLETLNYDRNPEDPHLIVEFLAGLPDTLVTLSSTDAASHSVNALSLLPSNLSQLVLSSSLDSVERFTNLASLHVLKPDGKRRQVAFNIGHWSHTTLASLTASGSRIPASLTHLDITCDFEDLKKLMHSSHLPKLETLQIRSENLNTEVEEVFGLVPPTVTSLTLPSWITVGSGEYTVGAETTRRLGGASTLIRPSIKLLEMRAAQVKNEHVLSEIISMAPNIEVFRLLARRSMPLGLCHLQSFDGALLRELSAPIALDCFDIGSDGTYPLASLLPKLLVLRLQETEETKNFGGNLNFGGIPPSVTEFSSIMRNQSTSTLHLLPPSITRVHLSPLAVSVESENLAHLFPSPAPLISETGVMDAPDAKTLVNLGGPTVWLFRYRDGTIGTSKVELKGNIGVAYLIWPKLIPFESLLGCSEVSFVDIQFQGCDSLTRPSSRLSSLTKITMGTFHPPWLVLAELPSLTDLQLGKFADFADEAAIPPTLTRLSCLGTNQPMSLPCTLKVLICKDLTPSALARLDLLEEWEEVASRGPKDPFLDWRGAFPTSVTKLKIPWQHLYHNAERCWSREEISIHLFDRLPRLKHLSLGRELPHTLVEALCDTIPSDVTLTSSTLICDDYNGFFPLVANRIGLCHGGFEILPHESLLLATARVTHRAYGHLNVKTHPSLPAYWPSLYPYLSANTTRLEISDFQTVVDDDGVVLLPPLTATLICKMLRLPLAKPALLPPQLRKLVIQASQSPLKPESTFILPSGMTHLDVCKLEALNPSFAWPSSLTFLRTSLAPKQLEKMLSALPTSLVHLCLEKPTLPQALFSSLPQGLKRFEGSLELSDQRAFAEYAVKAGLTWIVPLQAGPKSIISSGSKGECLGQDFNFESSLDILAFKPSTN